MILPPLISLIALHLVQAKHFLVETEDKEENSNEEDRLLDLLEEKQVSAIQNMSEAIKDPQNAEAIGNKLHQAFGDDYDAVRLPLSVL